MDSCETVRSTCSTDTFSGSEAMMKNVGLQYVKDETGNLQRTETLRGMNPGWRGTEASYIFKARCGETEQITNL